MVVVDCWFTPLISNPPSPNLITVSARLRGDPAFLSFCPMVSVRSPKDEFTPNLTVGFLNMFLTRAQPVATNSLLPAVMTLARFLLKIRMPNPMAVLSMS
ncbi:MAG: hypothetical protein ACD_73C00415G0001 [uncultured bacterium]|nr:MAG: hypothetical protein ACD_73C00415G0001 [uncultured bacterium]